MQRASKQSTRENEEIRYYLDLPRDGTAAEKDVARNSLADICEKRGLIDEAIELYESIISGGRPTKAIYIKLAAAYLKLGKEDLADSALVKANELSQLPPQNRQRKGYLNGLSDNRKLLEQTDLYEEVALASRRRRPAAWVVDMTLLFLVYFFYYLIKLSNGMNGGFTASIIMRILVGQGLSSIPVIGVVYYFIDHLMIFRKDSRTLHDHIAGTHVVMARSSAG